MRTEVWPALGPLVGEKEKSERGGRYVNARVFVERSTPFVRTSTATMPGIEAGAVHVTSESECHVAGTIPRAPNEHIIVVVRKKGPPNKFTVHPPISAQELGYILFSSAR